MEVVRRAGSFVMGRRPSGIAPDQPAQREGEQEQGAGDREAGRKGRPARRQSSLMRMLERRSSWLIGGGGDAVHKAGDGLRSQQVRFERLLQAVFPGVEETPGGLDWRRGVLGRGVSGVRKARNAESVRRVLAGHADPGQGDLAIESRTARLFIACCGADTDYERDAFLGFCAPYLRRVCRAEGLELEVVDLQRGALPAVLEQPSVVRAYEAKMQECMEYGVGVNFVALLGNKIGGAELPARIDRDTFEAFLEEVHDADGLLKTWFVLEENERPPAYVVRPQHEVIEGFDPRSPDCEATREWEESVKPALLELLRVAASKAALRADDPEMAERVLRPRLERLVRHALAAETSEPLLFIRTLADTGAGAPLNDSDVFVDFGDNYAIEEATERREALLADIERDWAGQRHCFEVPWQGRFDPMREEQHSDYLRAALTEWTHGIEKSIAERRRLSTPLGVHEALQSQWFALARSERTHVEQPEALEIVHDAMAHAKVVTVTGPRGCGKTSLLAHLAVTMAASAPSAVVVARFPAAALTPQTPTLALVKGLQAQIASAYAPSATVRALPDDYSTAVTAFWKSLRLASEDRPLHLVLDDIARLGDSPSLDWLPPKDSLPDHVTILMSAEAPEQLAELRCKRYSRFVPLPAPREVANVLDTWLARDNRALQPGQRAALLATFEAAEEPSFQLLHMLYTESCEWRSWTPVPAGWAGIRDVNSALTFTFERVEAELGAELVAAALSLVTMARDGLSLMELQDLLSVDHTVLESDWCFPGPTPPTVPRVPAIHLVQLTHALRALWAPSCAHTGRYWFHSRTVHDFAFARYCPPARASRTANMLADYFVGYPVVPPVVVERLKVRLGPDRLILQQTAHVISSDSTRSRGPAEYNQRRLREAPRALLLAGRTKRVVELLQEPDFLRGMLVTGAVKDFLYLLEAQPDMPEPALRNALARAVRQSRLAIADNIEAIEEQLWGRLEPVLGSEAPLVRALDASRHKYPGLHARWANVLEPANGPLLGCLGALDRPIQAMAAMQLQDGRRIVMAGTSAPEAALWDLESGDQLALCGGHEGGVQAICALELWDARALFACSSGATVRVWNAGSGTLQYACEGHSLPVSALFQLERPDGVRLLVSGSLDGSVRAWDAKSGSPSWVRQSSGSITAMCAVELMDGQSAAAGASEDGVLRLWDSMTGEVLREMPCSGEYVAQLAFVRVPAACAQGVAAPGLSLVAAGCSSGSVLLFDCATGALHGRQNGHRGAVLALCSATVKGEKALLASAGADGQVVLWDARKAELHGRCKGHGAAVPCLALTYRSANQEAPLLVSASEDASVRVWNMETTAQVWRSNVHHAGVSVVQVVERASGHECILSGSNDRTVVAWDASAQTRVTGAAASAPGGTATAKTPRAVAPSKTPRGVGEFSKCRDWICAVCAAPTPSVKARPHMVVSGSIDCKIRAHCAATGDALFSLEGHTKPVQALCAEGHVLASSGEDRCVRLWDLRTGKALAVCEGHEGTVWALASVRVMKRTVFCSGAGDSTVKFWGSNGSLICTGTDHTDSVRALARAQLPGGAPVIVSGSSDRTVRLWSPAGECQSTLRGHESTVNALAFAQDSGLLASGSSDQTVRLWHLGQSSCTAVIRASSSDGLGAFRVDSAAGRSCFVSASFADKEFTFWDARTGRFIMRTPFPSPHQSAAIWSANGVLVFGCEDGRLAICGNQPATLRACGGSGGLRDDRTRSLVSVTTQRPVSSASHRVSTLRAGSAPSLFRAASEQGRPRAQLQRRATVTPMPLRPRAAQSSVADDYEPEPAEGPPAHEAILLGVDSWSYFI